MKPCRHKDNRPDCRCCAVWDNDPAYREAVALLRTPKKGGVVTTPAKVVLVNKGVGTEYKVLTDKLGLKEWEGCGCAAIRQQMDRAGVAGCQSRRGEFIGKIKANVAQGIKDKKIGRRDWTRAIVNGIRTGVVLPPFNPLAPIASLYDLAMRNAAARELQPNVSPNPAE